MIYKKIILILMVVSSLVANNVYKIDYDNTEVEFATWEAKISGDIKTDTGVIDFKDTLGYGDANYATYLSLNIDNDSETMPDIKISVFFLEESSNTTLDKNITINNQSFNANNSISTETNYNAINTLLYGYIEEKKIKFTMGVNLKYIDFGQNVKDLTTGNQVKTVISGFSLVPYVGFDYNFNKYISSYMNVSIFSTGDIEVKDYAYGINYNIINNLYASYGYKYEGIKNVSGTDRFDFQTTGQMLSLHLKF